MNPLPSILMIAFAVAMLPADARAGAAATAQSPAAASVSSEPAGVEAVATQWLRRLRTGQVDRSRLSDTLKSQFTPTVLHRIASFLKALGDTTAVSYSGAQHVRGVTVYIFLLTFKGGRLDETLALDAHGKIAGIYFKPRAEVRGAEVEATINERLAPFVRSQSAQLTVAAASCPQWVDLSRGPGHCSLGVDGIALPIYVAHNAGGGWKANFAGPIYLRPETEAFVEHHLLSMYGVAAIARCEGTSISVLRPGTLIRCTLTGSSKISTIALRTPSAGKDGFFVFPPAGLTNTLPFTDAAASAHRRKERIVLTDVQLDAFLDRWISTLTRRGEVHIGRAACPVSSDLTGAKSVICTVPFDDQPARYRVWIDDEEGILASQLDAVIGKDLVERLADQQISQRGKQDGASPHASVDCGSRRLIITPAPGGFFCNVSVGSAKGKAHFVVEDSNGTLHWDGVEMEDGAAASPKP